MNDTAVPHGNDRSGFAGHGGMRSILGQLDAVDGIMGVRRHGPYHVAGIDVFQIYRNISFSPEMFLDGIFQIDPYVAQNQIARSVFCTQFACDVVLTRSLRRKNDRVILSSFEPVLQYLKEAFGSLEI